MIIQSSAARGSGTTDRLTSDRVRGDFVVARGSGTTDRLTSDRVRGGFVMVDPSVRRLRRPVARRLKEFGGDKPRRGPEKLGIS